MNIKKYQIADLTVELNNELHDFDNSIIINLTNDSISFINPKSFYYLKGAEFSNKGFHMIFKIKKEKLIKINNKPSINMLYHYMGQDSHHVRRMYERIKSGKN